ncbi:MAG TPA: glycosyltransferase family 87 protein [Candidatus Sulfotelmatobacter sp.]|nr:glycosyltransferase family 87 protein [Candidatus Sulfotelmatobacter sp.]
MKAWAWLLVGVAASAVSWTYMHRILLPWEHYINVEHGWVKAAMGDLYPRWVGTQELLLHGENPYSTEVSHKIQIAFYGRSIEQSYDKPQFEIIDEQRFAYPVYVVFLLAPTVHADFEALQRWTPIVLGALTVVSIWLWLSVLHWRPPLWLPFVLMLVVLSTPQIAQGMRLRQFGLLAAFLLAFATWFVMHKRLFLAGVLLAVATIKPQMVVLCLVWFFIWSLGDWRKRWPLAAGFGVTLGMLVGAGEILVPGWIGYFLEGMAAYRRYFPLGNMSVVRLILGNWIGGIVSVLAVGILLVYAWNRREVPVEAPEFTRVLSFFFITASLVLPLLTPYNQVLLLLPLLMLIRDWKLLPRWDRIGFALFLAWPFVAAAALLIFPPPVDTHRTALLPSALLPLGPFLFFWLMFTLPRREALS